MSGRLPGLALGLAALALFGLLVRPAWVETAVAREAELRAHQERREARRRLMLAERDRGSPSAGKETPARLRKRVLALIEGARVQGVSLDVAAESTAPVVRLSAEGGFADLVELAGRLARREAGLALEHVRLTPMGARLRLDMQAAGWQTVEP